MVAMSDDCGKGEEGTHQQTGLEGATGRGNEGLDWIRLHLVEGKSGPRLAPQG